MDHTKGIYTERQSSGAYLLVDEKGRKVATVHTRGNRNEAKANAHLFAAAPAGHDAALCAVSFLDEYAKTAVGRAAEQLFGAEMRAFLKQCQYVGRD